MAALGISDTTQDIESTDTDSIVPVEIGGWLLVLVVILTFVYPARSLYAIFWRAVPRLIGAQGLSQVFLLASYCGVFGIVGVVSFFAGIKLWFAKPHAVTFAKRWLLGYMIANFSYFVLWIVVVSSMQEVSLAEMSWAHVVGPIASTALWYFYLENSERVRATYRPE